MGNWEIEMVEKIGGRQTSAAAEAAPVVAEDAKNLEQQGKAKNQELKFEAKNFESSGAQRKEILNFLREENEANLKQMVGLGLMDEATAKRESQRINEDLKTQEEAFFRAKNGESKIRDFGAENRDGLYEGNDCRRNCSRQRRKQKDFS